MVDRALEELVRTTLPFPEDFERVLTQMRFPSKLALAQAQGALLWPASFKALNSLRNKVAHEPELEVDEVAVRSLMAAFEPDFGESDELGRFGRRPIPSADDTVTAALRKCLLSMLENLHEHAMSELDSRIQTMEEQTERLRRLRGEAGS